MNSETGYSSFMALEVSNIGIIVRCEIANSILWTSINICFKVPLVEVLTVLFCTSIYNTRTCMRKLCQLDTILFAMKVFFMATLPDVIYLYGLIA